VTATGGERQEWVDTARGIGIILVVYAHALRGQVVSGAFDPTWHADTQDAVIYAFHMPLFFFLAGLFARHSIRKPPGAFLRDKAITIVYPYFMWSIISVSLALLAAGAVNNAMSASAILNLWAEPVYQYWFLYALLICHLITLATRADWRVAAVLCVVSALALVPPAFGMIWLAMNYYVYFGLGLLFAPYLLTIRVTNSVAVLVAVSSILIFIASFVLDVPLPFRLLGIGRAVLGVAAASCIAMLLASRIRWLAVLGTASMAIYVLHTILSAGVRIGLAAVGFPNNLITLVLGTLIGILMPFAIWLAAREYRMLSVLGLGAQPRRRQDISA
jgi:fucose 4-O-acetylase-like acetyltransferase